MIVILKLFYVRAFVELSKGLEGIFCFSIW